MADEPMQNLVLMIAKALVDKPDEVEVLHGPDLYFSAGDEFDRGQKIKMRHADKTEGKPEGKIRVYEVRMIAA